ncbi:MAG: flavodoxin domain-containing protein [Clostridium perfringens]|nr:flavodoxin domain-containing protein [Clostridium perfringens]
MKISIIYHSETGNTSDVASLIEEGIKSVGDIKTKAMNLESIDKDFVNESQAIIFGCPTYYATYSWQIKKWFDETASKEGINLSDKLGGIFVTENHIGGGAEMAAIGLAGMMLVKGMLVYSAGSSKGQPYTHIGAVTVKKGDDFQRDRAKLFGERMANKALEIFK